MQSPGRLALHVALTGLCLAAFLVWMQSHPNSEATDGVRQGLPATLAPRPVDPQAELQSGSPRDPSFADRAAIGSPDVSPELGFAEIESASPSDAEIDQGVAPDIDSLVQRLREEATQPGQFHARALPIIEALGRALDECAAPEVADTALVRAGSWPVQPVGVVNPAVTAASHGAGSKPNDSIAPTPPVPSLSGQGPGSSLVGAAAAGGEGVSPSLGTAPPDSESPDQALRLLRDVVQAPDENPLVRSAVFLAISPRLDVAEFRAHFDDWIAPGEAHPLELVRAAAIAAALRGPQSACHQGLRLGMVMNLPGDEDSGIPGIYPLELRRTADAYGTAGIEAWLKASDARREALEQAPMDGPEATPPESSAQDQVGTHSRLQLIDYWTTLALLYSLWGHAGLEDSAVVGRIVKDGKPSMLRFSTKDVITLLPAVFLAQSLGPCNDRLAKLVVALENSGNDLYNSVVEAYAGCGQDPLRIEKLAKLKELRLSNEPFADAQALSLLIEWRAVAGRFSLASEQDRKTALTILAEVAGDPEAEVTERMMAWVCIDETDSPEILDASRLVCGPDMPDLLFGRLMTRLDQFSADESLRASLLEHLVWMRGLGMNSQRAAAIEALLDSLEQSNE
jgi:hypothetical protein